MEHKISKDKKAMGGIMVFIVFLGVWLVINYGGFDSRENRQIWAACYQVMAFYGGVLGILFSKPWGGYKSLIGRAVLAISCGLLMQCFGQSAYSYYIFYRHIAVPYPSIGDIGYFGSVLLYIYGVFQLAKASGAAASLKSQKNKLGIALIPAAMLGFSYFFFLRGYEVDWSNLTKVFLDFGYPFGEALYVSIALLTLVFCRQLLGGIMRRPVLLLVFAFIFQYLADFTFLYQSSRGTWLVGSINDLMYSFSYLMMSMGLIYIGKTFYRIRES